MNKTKEELKNLNVQQLKDKIEELRREMFTLKLDKSVKHIKDYSQYKKLRKAIAQALTYLAQKSN